MKIEKFDCERLEEIARIFCPTGRGGLSNDMLDWVFKKLNIPDAYHAQFRDRARWIRLAEVLKYQQEHDGSAIKVCMFLEMFRREELGQSPVNMQWLSENRRYLNEILVFEGLVLREDGHLYIYRGVHPNVQEYCDSDFINGDYFNAVQNAIASVRDKMRSRTGLSTDGWALVEEVFGGDRPRLRINHGNTESEKNEQKGFKDVLKGIFSMFRNPLAHNNAIEWPISREDAEAILLFVGLVHRRIDNSERYSNKN